MTPGPGPFIISRRQLGKLSLVLCFCLYDEAKLLEVIRGHWDAVENGAHYRRDVSMGEDASGISKRTQAHVMVSLRNLALGLFERQKHKTKDSFPSWRRKMTASKALKLLTQAG